MKHIPDQSDSLKGLGLPALSQICIVVRDLDKAVEYYEDVLGLGPFVRPEVSYTEKSYQGEPTPDSEWIMAFCSLGPVELELTQPVRGKSIYQDFLNTHGEGIHHLGFDGGDLTERIAHCKSIGVNVLSQGHTPSGGYAHLNTAGIGGAVIELIQRASRRV